MYDQKRFIPIGPDSTIKKGQLAWFVDLDTLIGPFVIIKTRMGGYGANRRKIAILLDIETGTIRSSDRRWLWVPMEIT